MRERMYGWMTLKLKDEGDGSPLPDPEMKLEDPETIRCYPGDSRPDDWVTLPQFAAAEGRQLVKGVDTPDDAAAWESQQIHLRTALLRSSVFRSNPRPSDGPTNSVTPVTADAPTQSVVSIESEPGVTLECQLTTAMQSAKSPAHVVVIANLDAENSELVKRMGESASQQGWAVLVPKLRATGEYAPAGDKIGHAPDHNSGQWGVWVDRPLLGQWAHDLQRVVAATRPATTGEVAVVGIGTAGPVVLCAAAVDSRITRVATVNTLSSYISAVPYRGQRFGVLAPGILRDVGDIEHIASLVAPRPLTIAGGVTGGGVALDDTGLKSAYDFTHQVYGLAAKEPALTIRTGEFDVAEFLKSR